jgi:hypothetical protein
MEVDPHSGRKSDQTGFDFTGSITDKFYVYH